MAWVGILGISLRSSILRVLLSGLWASGSQFQSPRDPVPGSWVSGSVSQVPESQSHSHNDIHKSFINELESWKNGDPECDRFQRLFEKCVTYMEETMAGSHGKITQFWINYSYLMDMFLLTVHRAMKMNDTQLFAYVFHEISSIFFSTNHQNNALSTTLYSLELISLPEDKLNFIEMLHNE